MTDLPFLVDKKFCIICGLPVNSVNPRGACMKCDDEAKVAGTIAALSVNTNRGFKEALAEVKKTGRPMTLDLADTVMDKLGGVGSLAEMIVDDFNKLRGTNLDDDVKQFHDPDWKTLKGYTDILVRLMSERDKLVGDSGDPLDGVSEEDLMSIASVSAMLRLETDPAFRKQLLDAIVPLDPEAVLDAAGEAINIIESRPKVEVIDAEFT